MWSALPNGGLLSGSNEESLYRDMFNQAISEELAKSQPLGIKDVILKEMQKNTKE
jgi:Rod binding domain-containing protein